MDKIICFIYTETTHLHEKNDFSQNELSKKNLYCFNRLVSLTYEIGYYKNKQFITTKKVNHIVKPQCMYITEYSTENHHITQDIANDKGKDIVDIITELKLDINKIDIIIGYNINYHLKTLLAETIRYNMPVDLSSYIIIDINNFYHNFKNCQLEELFTLIDSKNAQTKNFNEKIDIIKLIFFKLYSQFKKSLK
jgi:hypothetical protein